jgi:hypothetical protein
MHPYKANLSYQVVGEDRAKEKNRRVMLCVCSLILVERYISTSSLQFKPECGGSKISGKSSRDQYG